MRENIIRKPFRMDAIEGCQVWPEWMALVAADNSNGSRTKIRTHWRPPNVVDAMAYGYVTCNFPVKGMLKHWRQAIEVTRPAFSADRRQQVAISNIRRVNKLGAYVG